MKKRVKQTILAFALTIVVTACEKEDEADKTYCWACTYDNTVKFLQKPEMNWTNIQIKEYCDKTASDIKELEESGTYDLPPYQGTDGTSVNTFSVKCQRK